MFYRERFVSLTIDEGFFILDKVSAGEIDVADLYSDCSVVWMSWYVSESKYIDMYVSYWLPNYITLKVGLHVNEQKTKDENSTGICIDRNLNLW